MQKISKNILSILIIILGLIIISPKETITGAVIKTNLPIINIMGSAIILLGLLILLMKRNSNIEEIVGEIYRTIDNQKEKYKSNPKFTKGLKIIEREVEEDRRRYYKIIPHNKKESYLKKAILKRLKKRKEGLERRLEHFFDLPSSVKHKEHKIPIIDLPDKGLYNYKPIKGRKSKYIELEISHYTKTDSYKKIKKNFEKGEDNFLLGDINGWAYFVSKPLPEKLKTRTLRTILGTGNQNYVGKISNRDPEYEIKLKIKIPKERVLKKEEKYHLPNGKDISVIKYAIAGGISKKDVIDIPKGKRYPNKNLPKQHLSKEEEKWIKD